MKYKITKFNATTKTWETIRSGLFRKDARNEVKDIAKSDRENKYRIEIED